MTGYDFHPEAALDLDEIWEFIAEANLDAADRVIVDILAALDKLLPFPTQGHKRPDLTSRPLRFTLVREYLIAYAPDEKPLGLLREGTDAATRAGWPRFYGGGENSLRLRAVR